MSSPQDPPQRPFLGHLADAAKPITVAPGVDLSIHDVVAVARGDGTGQYANVVLGGDWKDRCSASADYVQRAVNETMGKSPEALAELTRQRGGAGFDGDTEALAARALIYGVTTGFGHFKNTPLDSIEAAARIQHNILRSHATGVGPPLPTEVVRAMMLLRVRTFVEGHSGITPTIVELLVSLINKKVHPWVPAQGSVGASGDLCPLSHLALPLVGEGLAWLDDPCASPGYEYSPDPTGTGSGDWDTRIDRRPPPRPARDVLKEAGLESSIIETLNPKDGLALSNGTSTTTALAVLAVYDAAILYGTANLAASMTLQGLLGATRAFDPKVHAVRRHDGQRKAAEQILGFAAESKLVNRSNEVQDAYSLRCAPAVHGASHHAIEHAWGVIEQEINAVTDNPLFFDADESGKPCDDYATCIWDAYAAGNFHAQPIGLVADYLKIAVAELASISERRTQYLLDEHHSRGLPANLWPDPATAGVNSGLMIAQYAAASLVSENKILAHPASVDSIPTSSNAEDHVSMATIAARHAREVVANVRNVLAIEILCATQALDLRLTALCDDDASALSPAARAVRESIRTADGSLPAALHLEGHDREVWPDIASINARIASGELLLRAINAR
ncbi:MAG: histidine ammonia-lyase [Planctomycetes bacterium]|nr:histidine ammonia-lyase [Planctomycetota bacterium]